MPAWVTNSECRSGYAGQLPQGSGARHLRPPTDSDIQVAAHQRTSLPWGGLPLAAFSCLHSTLGDWTVRRRSLEAY